MRPTLFIASSSRDARVLNALEGLLKDIVVVKWVEGQHELGREILDWVLSEAKRCDFGLFVLSPDERWGGKPNANVLLEMGLFMGRLGPDRCFILRAKDTEVPADVDGRIRAEYDREEFEQQGAGALEVASRQILEAVRIRQHTLVDEIEGLWLETKQRFNVEEGPYSLLDFDVKAGVARVRGRSYDHEGAERVSWPDEVDVCWIPPAEGQLYHTFDAHYGPTRLHRALGVNHFLFQANRREGSGYYVVHGSGGISQGAVPFTLTRITREYLAGLGRDSVAPGFDERDRCQDLIRHLLQQRRGRGVPSQEGVDTSPGRKAEGKRG